MNIEEVDKTFKRVGDAIVALPGERLQGFLSRAEQSSVVIASNRVGLN